MTRNIYRPITAQCLKLNKKKIYFTKINNNLINTVINKRSIFLDQVFRTKTECWKCKESISTNELSCPSCGAFQQPNPTITYFEIFNIPQKFEVDVQIVSKKFKDLQKIFHPDKVAQKSEEEIVISEKNSRLLNEAYRALRDPLKRGIYLLKLNGMTFEDSSEASVEPGFLMEIMEKNEELEKMNDIVMLKKELDDNKGKKKEIMELLSKAFEDNDFSKARIVLMKLKYYDNIDKKIRGKLPLDSEDD